MAEQEDLAAEVEGLDVDQLLAKLKDQTKEASELSKSLEKEPTAMPPETEELIRSIAKNVASMREAAGLPSEEAHQIAARIRRQSETPSPPVQQG